MTRALARRLSAASISTLIALAAPASAATSEDKDGATYEDKGVAVLQGLDKITARVWTFEAPISEPVRFGTLEIVVQACKKRPPEEPPESAAFLQVIDHRVGGGTVPLFRGWMFASSPALSALEHPVYDVWVLDCK